MTSIQGQRRRVIFPCLHGPTLPSSRHEQITRSQSTPLGSRDDGVSSASSNSTASPLIPPCLVRSNSLPQNGRSEEEVDVRGIYLPLPPLPNEKAHHPKPLRRRPSPAKAMDSVGLTIRDSIVVHSNNFDQVRGQLNSPPSYANIPPSAQAKEGNIQKESKKNKWVVPAALLTSPTANTTESPKAICGGAVNPPRTYYPAATIPKYHEPQNKSPKDMKDESNSQTKTKPLKSILRRRSHSSPSSLQRSSSTRSDGVISNVSSSASSPISDDSMMPQSPSLSSLPSAPTLASPKSIRSLNNSHDSPGTPSRGDEKVVIGESEYTVEHISDAPKILQRNTDDQKKLRRNSSDTVVAKSEEECRQRQRRVSEMKSANAEQSPIDKHSEENAALKGEVAPDASRSDSLMSSRDSARHHSLECLATNKNISFDPHIWVYEYQLSPHERKLEDKWFTEEELTQFKQEAIQRIRMRSLKMIPTGTGRTIAVARDGDQDSNKVATSDGSRNGKSVCYSHPALSCDDEFDHDGSSRSLSSSSRGNVIQDALSREMRNVLVVDPHDIFLKLFTKSLKYMIPHVSVATARSGEEALARIEAAQKAFRTSEGGAVHGFDIIIVEERLQKIPCQRLSSGSGEHDNSYDEPSTQAAGDDSVQRRPKLTLGSTLLRSIAAEEQELRKKSASGADFPRFSLLIGVSSRLSEDRAKMEKSGADFVWGKPPPEMNSKLRNELLKALLKKRNKLSKN